MNENKKQTLKKVFINAIIFIGLILLTFYIIFKDNSIGDILSVIKMVDVKYLLVGCLCMFCFMLCEATNIGRILNLFGCNVGIFKSIKYALVGFFFSSVTPSASGGQPMQVYFMHKDDIDLSHSTLTLLIELASFQFIGVSLALVGFILSFDIINSIQSSIKYLMMIGVALNVAILIILLLTIFSKRIIGRLVNLLIWILNKFKYSKVDTVKEKLNEQITEYKKCAVFFKENKFVAVKILLTTLIQLCAFHSIPYFVYLSFGFNAYPIWTVLAMQAVLYICVSALPLPGAVGVSESGFLILFKSLFPVNVLSSAMLLSRSISFYLFVLISGILVSFIILKLNTNKKIVS